MPSIRSLATLALAALALLAVAMPGGRAEAQVPPFSAYGMGLEPGQAVVAIIREQVCADTAADATGNWLLEIAASAPCQPLTGDVIRFKLDGVLTGATETWKSGGVPADVTNGVALGGAADTVPPVLVVPAAIEIFAVGDGTGAPATHGDIAYFLASARAEDAVDGVLDVWNDAPDVFPLGVTTVHFKAIDRAGNRTLGEATVRVKPIDGQGSFLAPIGSTGIQAGVWLGGSVELIPIAAAVPLKSFWVFQSGKPVGYTPGAPGFVNRAFLVIFPEGFIPANQILLLVIQ